MKLICLVIPFFFLGCSTDQPRAETRAADSSTNVAGTTLGLPDSEAVRHPEALKAYPTGRYEDPEDPSVMHEAHVIYRAEQPPSWNLNPPLEAAVPLGPTVAVTDPAKDTDAMKGELEQKIQQQNQLLQATFEQNQKLSEELKKLQDDVAKTQGIVSANATLQKQVADLQAQLTELQQALAAQSHPTPPVPTKPAEQPHGWQFWTSPSTPTPTATTATQTKGNK